MKILIVKLSSIGDIVHALPALAAIKRALPEAEISWAAEKRAAEILRNNPLLENLIEVDTRELRREKSLSGKLKIARRQLKTLKIEKFDVALDFQGLLKSGLIAKLSGAKRRVGFARETLREPASRFFLTETVEISPRIHVIEKNLRLAEKALNIPIPTSGEDFEFPIATDEHHRLEAVATVEKTGENFIILNPGGGWKTKIWAAKNFGALADRIYERLGLKSIVSYGPGEENLAEAVLEASRTHQSIAASLSLKGFYELSKRAKLYVGGDTGPTHLAVAAGTPVVGIFGPTEWWRNGSPRRDDICVERTDIDCRENCHRRACDKWICLNIEVGRVLRAAEKRLQSAKVLEKLETVKIA
jgi:heptosyltransferase I